MKSSFLWLRTWWGWNKRKSINLTAPAEECLLPHSLLTVAQSCMKSSVHSKSGNGSFSQLSPAPTLPPFKNLWVKLQLHEATAAPGYTAKGSSITWGALCCPSSAESIGCFLKNDSISQSQRVVGQRLWLQELKITREEMWIHRMRRICPSWEVQIPTAQMMIKSKWSEAIPLWGEWESINFLAKTFEQRGSMTNAKSKCCLCFININSLLYQPWNLCWISAIWMWTLTYHLILITCFVNLMAHFRLTHSPRHIGIFGTKPWPWLLLEQILTKDICNFLWMEDCTHRYIISKG